MEKNLILKEISQKDFDRDYFVKLINSDTNIRDLIINEMLLNTNIMIYYHCYYVVSDASKKAPYLYYKYWYDFVKLLDHENSYHRDIGLTLIANIVHVDQEDRLSLIWSRYLEHINDEKFMTAECCINNIRVILKTRADMLEEVVDILLNLEKTCDYTENQVALLEYSVLNILDDMFFESNYKDEIIYFIRKRTTSISPKTRKRAKQLIKKLKI